MGDKRERRVAFVYENFVFQQDLLCILSYLISDVDFCS